jgi:hypothetical protein
MKVDLRYHGRSGVREAGGGVAMAFAPNLSRAPVFFDEEIADPLRFREAVSALHEVVIGDLRRPRKDRSAHQAYLAREAAREQELREVARDRARLAELERIAAEPIPPNLEADFHEAHRRYWTERRRWAWELQSSDPALFRALVPCDPVVTVAPDVVMFECFAKDEASYGCLSVDREGFKGGGAAAALGTTNVDYSLALYEHFQTLRSYRPTRLLVDPTGFEVAVASGAGGGGGSLREEKIDLPASWLRGFGQLQAAMALPARQLELSTDVVYSILAYLKRHREKTGPRSLRFVLSPGKPPRVVLEPWGVELTSRGKPYDGPVAEEINVWGRRRLFALARTLPFAERFELRLLGTGLPSVWTARLGAMRLTLALSGWTANDWARGSALDQHFARYEAQPGTVDALARYLVQARAATRAELQALPALRDVEPATLLGSLHQLAQRGQLVYDFAAERYRWRPILEQALSEAMLGPEPEEVVAGRRLATQVKLARDEGLAGGRRLVVGRVGYGGIECEAVIDGDGAMSRARCSCSHFFRLRLRAGPCRHLLALRLHVTRVQVAPLPIAVVVSPGGGRGDSPSSGSPRRRPN